MYTLSKVHQRMSSGSTKKWLYWKHLATCCIRIGQDHAQFNVEISFWHSKCCTLYTFFLFATSLSAKRPPFDWNIKQCPTSLFVLTVVIDLLCGVRRHWVSLLKFYLGWSSNKPIVVEGGKFWLKVELSMLYIAINIFTSPLDGC